ncbi:hypothetical protein BSNK01_11960 [Bacillaceae bacterium]
MAQKRMMNGTKEERLMAAEMATMDKPDVVVVIATEKKRKKSRKSNTPNGFRRKPEVNW